MIKVWVLILVTVHNGNQPISVVDNIYSRAACEQLATNVVKSMGKSWAYECLEVEKVKH